MMTLREALDLVPDFRSSQGRRHSIPWTGKLATLQGLFIFSK